MASTTLTRDQKKKVHYPESDGKPMAETEFHLDESFKVRAMLRHYYQARTDAYVGANMLIYYQEGNPRKSIAPDIFIAFGVSKRKRRIYKLWEEGAIPAVVFEFTSKCTADEDLHTKRNLYERLGAQEYILIDVLGEYLPSPLAMYRLVEGHFAPVSVTQTDNAWRAHSDILNLDIVVQRMDNEFVTRLFDPSSGEWLINPEEAIDIANQLQTALTKEQEERKRLTQQIEQLKTELNRLKQS
ncbi:MAG: Uma2 family endonuclease [Fimbriimonadia bacterium]|nr:Uma2 family endonuclease [Fimbriimonadia bacterium]